MPDLVVTEVQHYTENLFRIKTVEMDLRGILNPTNELNTLFFDENCWLDFKDFFIYYYKKYNKELKTISSDNGWNEFTVGLRARLYRTQVGFLTEYHAFYLSKLIFGDERVVRSISLDKRGVDFQCIIT